MSVGKDVIFSWQVLPSLPLPDLIKALLISGSLGALIGLIRQWEYQRQQQNADHFSGLRTFSLWAILGTLSAYISSAIHVIFYAVSFGAFALFLVLTQTVDIANGAPP